MNKVLLFALCLSLPCWAEAAPLTLPVSDAVPGGVAVVQLPVTGKHAPKVELGEKRVMIITQDGIWYAVVGIPWIRSPAT